MSESECCDVRETQQAIAGFADGRGQMSQEVGAASINQERQEKISPRVSSKEYNLADTLNITL